MSSKELIEVKKECEFRRRQIVELEHELQEKDNRIIDLDHTLRRYENEIKQAHSTTANLDNIINERVQKTTEIEQERSHKMIIDLKNQVAQKDLELKTLYQENLTVDEKNKEIEFYKKKVDELSSQYGLKDFTRDMNAQRDQNLQLKKEIEKITGNWSELSNQVNDVISENRVLREMAGVPENFGFDLNEIKIIEKQKIEEYRGRIRRLESEVEELEKERVDLRYKLRNLSTLYGEKGIRFHDLNADQMFLIDEFARNLREGKADLPMNDRSRELLREVEYLKMKILDLEGHQGGVLVGTRDNEEILIEIRKEKKELIDLLLKLHASGPAEPTGPGREVDLLQLPPIPIKDRNGKFPEGYSFRFGSNIDVAEIYTGETDRDLAALQLQLIETLELFSRKDDDDKLTDMELQEFRDRLRQIILVIEQLYRQYNRERVQWKEEIDKNTAKQGELSLDLREKSTELMRYQEMARALSSNEPNSINGKIAELTSAIALLDVNNIRLARKYECLQAEEKEIRQAYYAFENEHSEKDVITQQTIGRLKEWRVASTLQLQYLLKRLKHSVTYHEYDKVSAQVSILQEREAEWMSREIKLHERISKYENMERENVELTERLKDEEELRIEIDEEADVIRKRLEEYDIGFRNEQSVLRRVKTHFKQHMISPEQAFQIFDRNSSSRISKYEFKSALEKIGIKLSEPELNSLVIAFDSDRDGSINFTEFIRKMNRLGVRSLTEEQQIIKTIQNAIQNRKYTLWDVFCIFDQDGDHEISTDEFIRCFQNFQIGLTLSQIHKVLRLIDTSGDGNIDYAEFSRVFSRNTDQNASATEDRDWKIQLFLRIKESIDRVNLDMREAFRAFDKNGDGRITKLELKQAFDQMEVGLTDAQIDDLFNTMNIDKDNSISYVEFLTQFQNAQQDMAEYQVIKDAERRALAGAYPGTQPNKSIAVLEAREQAALNKAERYSVRIKSLEYQQSELEKQLSNLERKYLEKTTKYHQLREDESKLRIQAEGSINRADAEQMRQSNETLTIELANTRAAMITYKGMVNICQDQVRNMQLSMEKRNFEIETFKNALRELESENMDNAAVGKLYHQVMVARWCEASSIRKYDTLLNETKTLRTDVFEYETKVMDAQKKSNKVSMVLSEKIASYELQIKEANVRASHNITYEKAQEYTDLIRDLGEKKSTLEDNNRKLRIDIKQQKLIAEEAEHKKLLADELMATLSTANHEEIKSKFIDISQKLSNYKLAELRARRDSDESKEEADYLKRLNAQHVETIRRLEQSLAAFETTIQQKEEQWRQQDDERQKMLLNPRGFGNNTVDEALDRTMENKIQSKEDEIISLKEKLDMAYGQIEQLSANAMGKSGNFVSQSQFGRLTDDANSIADAAQTTIQTLQIMLDEKNEKIEQQDIEIQKLRKDIIDVRNQWAADTPKYPGDLPTGYIQPPLIPQQPIVPQNPLPVEHERPGGTGRTSRMRNELEETKKQTIQARNTLAEKQREINDLNYQLQVEKTQNSRTSWDSEKRRLTTQLRKKESELTKLKEGMRILKEDLLKSARDDHNKTLAASQQAIKENSENEQITRNIRALQLKLRESNGAIVEKDNELIRLKEEAIAKKVELTAMEKELKASTGIIQRIQDEALKDLAVKNRLQKELDDIRRSAAAARPGAKPTTVTGKTSEEVKQEAKIAKLKAKIRDLKEAGAGKGSKTKTSGLESKDDAAVRRMIRLLRNKQCVVMTISTAQKLNEVQFRKALTDKKIYSTGDNVELDTICQIALSYAPAKIEALGRITPGVDLKKLDKFLRKVAQTQPRPYDPTASSTGPAATGQNVQQDITLKNRQAQIEMQIKEIKELESQVKTLRGESSQLKREKEELKNKIDLKPEAKGIQPPKHETVESMETLRAEIYELQEQNRLLDKKAHVTMASDVRKFQQEANRANEELRRMSAQRKPAQGRVTEVNRLEQRNEDLEKARAELESQLVESERSIMELKFEKETFDLQMSRVQRRLQDLETFKASVVKEGIKPSETSPPRVRFQPSESQASPSHELTHELPKTTREQDAVINEQKKLIDRITAENEHLKRSASSKSGQRERAKVETILNEKIQQLDLEVRELRSREEVGKGLQQRLKDVLESNDIMRKDLESQTRKIEAEQDKYRTLLISHDMLKVDNDKIRRALDELTLTRS